MNMSYKQVLGLICIASLLSAIDSARILGLFPTHSKSHLIVHSAVAEALAEVGHNVTVVSTHQLTESDLPYRYIYLNVPPISSSIYSEAVNKRPSYYKTITNFISAASKISNSSLHHPLMKKLMDEESFDLVILGYLFNDFMFGVAAHFKCPLVLSFSLRPVNNVNDLVGNPWESSYVPTLTTDARPTNRFLDRVRNFIFVTIAKELTYQPYLRLTQEQYYRANFPSDKYPSFDEMMKNISLVLTAHHFSQGPIRPDVPAVIEIGGIHIKDKPDPLPEDIQSILDNSTEYGAIYFSLGTNIFKKHLDPSKVKTMFEVLSNLSQTVLCKWSDEDFPLESPNIFYKKWLPQNSILHHPNVKLFITHGGLGSITESQFYGVPMVGIPLVNDQFVNVEKMQGLGFGLSLNYADLTEKIMINTVAEVFQNRTYAEKVKQFSRLYNDRPMSARQSAVYWVEYVMRHHGAPHLQSPAVHLNIFQLLSLDVIGFLFIVLILILKAIKVVLAFLKRMYIRIKLKKE